MAHSRFQLRARAPQPSLAVALAVLAASLLVPAREARAHPHIFFDVELEIAFGPGPEIEVVYTLHPDKMTNLAIYLGADENENGEIEPEEQEWVHNHYRGYFKKFKYFAVIRSDGEECALRSVEDFSLKPFPDDVQKFVMRYVVFATLPERTLGDHRLEVELSDPSYYAAFTQCADQCAIRPTSKRIRVEQAKILKSLRGVGIDYRIEEEKKVPGTAGGETGPAEPEEPQAPIVVTAGEETPSLRARFYRELKKGQDYLQNLLSSLSTDFRPGLFFTLMGFALAYGIFHALGPGHGKALVIAFLMRAQCRARHALGLSLIVTLTHTGTAVLLAGGVQILRSSMKDQSFQDAGQAWVGLGSGFLVLAIGAYPVSRFVLNVIGRMREKGSFLAGIRSAALEAPVEEAAEEERVTLARVGRWGVAAGLVPCPASIVIMLFATTMGVFWIGLATVISLAIGLSVVLLAIGLAVIYSRKGLLARLEGSPWNARLQAVFGAGGVLLVLGLAFLLIAFHWHRLSLLGAV